MVDLLIQKLTEDATAKCMDTSKDQHQPTQMEKSTFVYKLGESVTLEEVPALNGKLFSFSFYFFISRDILGIAPFLFENI